MTQERKPFLPAPSESVCQIYEFLRKAGSVSFPITNSSRDKVDGIVASVTGSYYGEEIYLTTEEKAVAYFYFLIKDHPFTDGNKRTAALTFSCICVMNNISARLSEINTTLDQTAVFIEQIREEDHHKVIKSLAELLF